MRFWVVVAFTVGVMVGIATSLLAFSSVMESSEALEVCKRYVGAAEK